MKKIKIALDDKILSALVEEQLMRLPDIRIGDDQPDLVPDLVIARVKTTDQAPHLLLGGKREEGVDVISLPMKLGDMVDRVRYILSGRTRFALNEPVPFGNYILNPEDGNLSDKISGKSVRLTDKEKLILLSLGDAPDKTLDRIQLLKRVWGYVESAETHTLETHLYRLRQKLETEFGAKDLVLTRDGLYTLNI